MKLKYNIVFFNIILVTCIFRICLSQNPNQLSNGKILEFDLSQQFSVPTYTTQIVLGDLDSDGDLDAVFANMRNFQYSKVLINDGNGNFTEMDQDLTQQAHGVALGDLDKDGDLDIFFTCSNYSVDGHQHHKPGKVYLNDGKANFYETGQDLGDTKLAGQKVNLVDIDNDGDLDAAVVYSRDTPNKIYLNDGNGFFTENQITFPNSHAWHDLDSDGDVDLFIWERKEGYLVKLNDGNGIFSDFWFVRDTTAIRGNARFADVDNDRDIDIVFTNGDHSESYPSKVFLNSGIGLFLDSKQQLSKVVGGRIGLGDMNNDGFIDAVITGLKKPSQIWLNDRTGNFKDSGVRLKYNGAFHSTELGDVDQDGDLDIFIANYKGGSNQLWLNRIK